MLSCPHCKKPAISQLRKAFLGPAMSVACKSCKKPVSVSWCSFFAVIPMLIGITVGTWIGSPTGIFALLVGYGITTVIHAWYVPIVPRGS